MVAVALLSTAACADDGPGSAIRDQPVATVEIERSRFDTTELHVVPGTAVEFVNRDAFAHTVTSRPDAPEAFDSGLLGEDDVFRVIFDEPGEYAYFCEIHPTMRGVVIVG